MSTRVTKRGIPMAESKSLQLVLTAAGLDESISSYVSDVLKTKGYTSITPATLNFLSTLECGINFGSEIARNLDISRQMVAKTVKSLCALGYLEQVEDIGKRKQIVFTALGEHLMSDARQVLAELDDMLEEQLTETSLIEAVKCIQRIQTILGTFS